MTPVPVFLNNPLYKSKPRLPTMSDRESLDHSQEDVTPASRVSHPTPGLPAHFYQTQFSHQHTEATPSLPPIATPVHDPVLNSVSLDPGFHGSRPDPLPPSLHPANNPINPLLINNLDNITPRPLAIPQTPLPAVLNSIPAKQHHPPPDSFKLFKSFKPANINTNLKPFPPFKQSSLTHSAPIRPNSLHPHHQHQVAHHPSPVVHHSPPVHHHSTPVHHHSSPVNHHSPPVHHHSPIHRPSLFSHPPPPFHPPAPVRAPPPPPYSPPAQSFSYDPFEFQQRLNQSTATANQLEPLPPAPRAPRKPPPPPSPPPTQTPAPAPAPPNVPPIPFTPVLIQPTPGSPGPGGPPLAPTPFPPVVLQPVPGINQTYFKRTDILRLFKRSASSSSKQPARKFR